MEGQNSNIEVASETGRQFGGGLGSGFGGGFGLDGFHLDSGNFYYLALQPLDY